MRIQRFETEHFYARYEFTTRHLLSTSDCESVSVAELVELAGESLAELGATTLGYGESEGHRGLREAIASRHTLADADDVLVVNAPVEGIFVGMSALLDRSDRVVVLGPCYDALANIPRHLSDDVACWMLQPTDEGWRLDLDALDRLLETPTKLLVVNFPHNPTGFLPTRAELTRIVDLCRRRGVWLFSDEMYRGLELSGTERLPSAADLYERSIVLAGLSKAHGLPGLRSGWLVIRDAALFQAALNWKFYTSICPPAPVERLALSALRAEDTLFRRNVERIERHVALADDFFARIGGSFTWRRPRAGSVALVGLRERSATDYCHALARDAGVVLLPSAFLGYDDRHVRFGFGRDGFPAALEAFERHLTAR